MLNRAMLRIGGQPLQTEADPGAPVHLAIYDSTLEHLAAFPWSFFKRTRKLTRLTAAPISGWQYAFQLPSTRMAPPRAVYADNSGRRPTTSYDIEGDQLLTDHEEIWATVLEKVSWERWPGDFRELFTVALMAKLALSVREDRVLSRELYAQAFGTPSEQGRGGLLGSALDNDNQGLPSETVNDNFEGNPLIDVRF